MWSSTMNRYEMHLQEMGVTLPEMPTPIANYIPAKRAGNLVFTAGQVSTEKGRDYKGKLGDDLSLDDARRATRACAINCLASIKAAIGTLDRVHQVVIHGLINSTLECTDQAAAINGASDFMVEVFGEAGKHVRTSAGVASMPMGFAASVYIIVEVE
jgi:enamine deaminase RidA (YjgF/YER057c/UK114 family)